MAYDFKYEHFNSIYDFERALNTRKVNDCFGSRPSSCGQDFSFTQTESYEAADELLKNGWNAEVENIERELQKFSRTIQVKRNRQIKSVAGYAPCVANAIRGVPKSMFATKTVERKEKKRSIHIILNNTASADTKSETLMKSGLTILKLAMVLDRMGVRTKIDVIPKMAEINGQVHGCTVGIKDYRQPFNLSKIAYPLAHVSFFRRHGFRFYESLEEYKYKKSSRYGSSAIYWGKDLKNAYFKFAGFLKDDVVYIDLNDVKNADFDYVKLAENKEISLYGGINGK